MRPASLRSRALAASIVAFHLWALAVPCLADADPGADGAAVVPAATATDAHGAHAHANGSGDDAPSVASSSDPHCGEPAAPAPANASAPCPCGCDDAAAPGDAGSRVGPALLRSITRAAPLANSARGTPAHRTLPRAPVRLPDPVPI